MAEEKRAAALKSASAIRARLRIGERV